MVQPLYIEHYGTPAPEWYNSALTPVSTLHCTHSGLSGLEIRILHGQIYGLGEYPSRVAIEFDLDNEIGLGCLDHILND